MTTEYMSISHRVFRSYQTLGAMRQMLRGGLVEEEASEVSTACSANDTPGARKIDVLAKGIEWCLTRTKSRSPIQRHDRATDLAVVLLNMRSAEIIIETATETMDAEEMTTMDTVGGTIGGTSEGDVVGKLLCVGQDPFAGKGDAVVLMIPLLRVFGRTKNCLFSVTRAILLSVLLACISPKHPCSQ